MKFKIYTAVTFFAATLLASGFVYDAPITEEHDIAIDPALLGLWRGISDEEEKPEEETRMVILKFSDTEDLIRMWPTDGESKGLFLRCYPIKIADIPCLQVQIIGGDDGTVGPDHDYDSPFAVVSYRLAKAELVFSALNPWLVGGDLKTSEALVDAFMKNKDSEKLFLERPFLSGEGLRFRRIEK